jgi:hypothetical protein
MKDRILEHLRLLNFLQEKHLPADELEQITSYLERTLGNPGTPRETPIPFEEQIPQQIVEIPNKPIALCLLRDCKHIDQKDNVVVYSNRKYKFNNVFRNSEYPAMMQSLCDFVDRRIASSIPSCIVLHGFSGSGKSTITSNLLKSYAKSTKFRLSEIYLNRLYTFSAGSKVEIKALPEGNAYFFESRNIMAILEKFQRKCPTSNNPASSRSHIILEIDCDGTVFTIIDLCGAENNESSEKIRKLETNFINQNLFNVSRYLAIGADYKERGDTLLNVLKRIKHVLVLTILHDGVKTSGASHLLLLKEFLKTIIPEIVKPVLEAIPSDASLSPFVYTPAQI